MDVVSNEHRDDGQIRESRRTKINKAETGGLGCRMKLSSNLPKEKSMRRCMAQREFCINRRLCGRRCCIVGTRPSARDSGQRLEVEPFLHESIPVVSGALVMLRLSEYRGSV
jgi:hypothetical protein